MSAEIEAETEAEITLTGGGGGVFDVLINGKLVFSKNSVHRFPDSGEIARLLRQR